MQIYKKLEPFRCVRPYFSQRKCCNRSYFCLYRCSVNVNDSSAQLGGFLRKSSLSPDLGALFPLLSEGLLIRLIRQERVGRAAPLMNAVRIDRLKILGSVIPVLRRYRIFVLIGIYPMLFRLTGRLSRISVAGSVYLRQVTILLKIVCVIPARAAFARSRAVV